jgi:hypothetical protein
MADEKFDEKEREKRDEKTAEEKWRRDPLGAIVWAAILIWAGLVFLADNLGYLEALRDLPAQGPVWFIGGAGAWSLVLLGAGVIILGEVVVRLLVPAYRRAVTGSIIFAVVLIGLGLGNLTNWNLIWPLILIGLGLSFLLRGFIRRSE